MQIAGYQIQEKIGRGGMATVYLAEQLSLQRQVALKIMRADVSKNPVFTQRFLNEGPIVASLTHPHIIKVFDTGMSDEGHYLAMEYMGGGTLRQRMAKLDVWETLNIIKRLGDALSYAHERGIIHRDLKPQNILFYERGMTPVLSDFGIAKDLNQLTGLTAAGLLGSPKYMSPEQVRGEKVDHRADLYSLGILLFEMLTGQPPYLAKDKFVLVRKHLEEPIPLLPLPLQAFQPILQRLMAKRSSERFATATDCLQALHEAEQEYIQYLAIHGGLTAPQPAAETPPPPPLTATLTIYEQLPVALGEPPSPSVPKRGLPRWIWILAIGLLILLVMLLPIAYWQRAAH